MITIKNKTFKIFRSDYFNKKTPWIEMSMGEIIDKFVARGDEGQIEYLQAQINFIFRVLAANPNILPDEIKQEIVERFDNSRNYMYKPDFRIREIKPAEFTLTNFIEFARKKLRIKFENITDNLCDFCEKLLMDGPAPEEWEIGNDYFDRLFELNKVAFKKFKDKKS